MFKILFIVLALAIFGGFTGSAYAKEPIYTGMFNDNAIGGYDTVEYFISGKATEGKEEFKLEYMGADWLFISQANMDAFKAAPEKYMPQYGGYCAWAMARGATAEANPEIWKIVNGKLYMNYNMSVQGKWEADIPGYIMKADEKYPVTVDLEK